MLLWMSLLAAIAGVVVSGLAYFDPESGIGGTEGALLAILGSVVLAATILYLLRTRSGLMAAFAMLVGVLTALAAWFLMQGLLVIATGVALVALIAALVTPQRRIAQ